MKKENLPEISIIVAVLNAEKFLANNLESIISQKYCKREIILIDGASIDNSLSIIRNYERHINYWVTEPDNGIYHAWNKALHHTKGEWICFLGADDYFWDEYVLCNYVPYLNQAVNTGIRIVYGKIARMDQKGNIIQYWGKPWEKIRWQMPHGMPLGMPHTGLMHHSSLFKNHGLFDDTLKLAGDYEFLLRELKDKTRDALFIEDLITVAQQIGGTADSNKFEFHQEVDIARRKNGLPKFSWLWWLIHIRAFLQSQLNKK